MKSKPKGEGHSFFPSFFLVFILFSLLSPWQAAAQKDLSRFDRLAEEATLLNQRGRSDEVIALLAPHRKEKKNDSALFFNELGVAYRNKKMFAEAAEAYDRAHALDRENPVILANLAYVYFLKKDYPAAVGAYEKAVRLAPRFKEAHSGLALALYQMGKYGEALQEIDAALKLDPSYAQARNLREDIRKKLSEQKK